MSKRESRWANRVSYRVESVEGPRPQVDVVALHKSIDELVARAAARTAKATQAIATQAMATQAITKAEPQPL